MPGGQAILSDIVLAVDTIKNIFSGSLAQDIVTSIQDRQMSSANNGGLFGGLPGLCVQVCAMNELTESLATMRDTLVGLQKCLITLEYCILVLTCLLIIIIVIGVVMGAIWLLCHWNRIRGVLSEETDCGSAVSSLSSGDVFCGDSNSIYRAALIKGLSDPNHLKAIVPPAPPPPPPKPNKFDGNTWRETNNNNVT